MKHAIGDQSSHEGEQFGSLVLNGEEIARVEYRDCTFVGCSFVEASFRASRFLDCVFRDCDLSLARVRECSFRRTQFQGSKAVGVNWAEAAWPSGKPLFPSVDFIECAITYSTFIGLRLNGIRIAGCVARDVDFSNADLSGADCKDTDFTASRFYHTNLTEADFTGATNYAVSPTHNTLKGTKFSFPEAISLLRMLDIVLTE